jgi:hypothetical protein
MVIMRLTEHISFKIKDTWFDSLLLLFNFSGLPDNYALIFRKQNDLLLAVGQYLVVYNSPIFKSGGLYLFLSLRYRQII